MTRDELNNKYTLLCGQLGNLEWIYRKDKRNLLAQIQELDEQARKLDAAEKQAQATEQAR